MLADAQGRPLRFLLAPGRSHDILAAPHLLAGHQAQAVLADRAYDTNALRHLIADMGALAVIPIALSTHPARLHDLSMPQPHRKVLQQAQTLPAFRNPLRPTSNPLPRLHPPRHNNDLDDLNVDWR